MSNTPRPVPSACTLVIPFFNEVEGTPAFLEELATALSSQPAVAEVILVDDGSTDGTREVLERAAATRPGWRVVVQAKNQGQAAALYRGMRLASSPVIVTMDGDGQNDPADIPSLLARLEETGADMVAGVRVERNDSWLRRRMSRLANGVRQRILRDGVRDTGCGLKVFRREVVEAFLPMRTLYSFMPALAVAGGFRVVEQPVRHRARELGTSKYGLGVMLWRPLLDLLGVWWFTRRRFQANHEDGAKRS
ncbi:MAG: dolichol-phosphate mannosyltransferase [Verrucomicrobia bacterium]|nr:dolichol-phosphate mannosyltransferase [Verrucomicrobiota bacterium]